MDKKVEFKNFVKENPRLIKFVKNGEMTWQKFYELYDMYGTDDNVWANYLKDTVAATAATAAAATTASSLSFNDVINWVKGIDLDGSYVIGSEVVNPGQEILIITDKGYGKRTVIDEYRLTHRGSKGVKALNITEKNGTMVALKRIESEEHDIVIVTDNGTIMKMPLNQVSLLRRATQGVRLINLKNNELVSTVALVTKEEEDN